MPHLPRNPNNITGVLGQQAEEHRKPRHPISVLGQQAEEHRNPRHPISVLGQQAEEHRNPRHPISVFVRADISCKPLMAGSDQVELSQRHTLQGSRGAEQHRNSRHTVRGDLCVCVVQIVVGRKGPGGIIPAANYCSTMQLAAGSRAAQEPTPPCPCFCADVFFEGLSCNPKKVQKKRKNGREG